MRPHRGRPEVALVTAGGSRNVRLWLCRATYYEQCKIEQLAHRSAQRSAVRNESARHTGVWSALRTGASTDWRPRSPACSSVYYQQITEDDGKSPQTAAVAADMGPSAPAAMAPPVGQRRQPGRPAQTAPPRQPQLAIDIAVHVSIDNSA